MKHDYLSRASQHARGMTKKQRTTSSTLHNYSTTNCDRDRYFIFHNIKKNNFRQSKYNTVESYQTVNTTRAVRLYNKCIQSLLLTKDRQQFTPRSSLRHYHIFER